MNTPAEPPAGGREVLVIDDDDAVTVPLDRLLSRRGVPHAVVRDPQEAIALVRENPDRFAVVLTDLLMPGMTGAELRDHLRVIQPRLPVLVSTGSAADDDELADFDGHLVKPYSVDALMAALAPWLT
jgi:CheY-like chemotaxis protein